MPLQNSTPPQGLRRPRSRSRRDQNGDRDAVVPPLYEFQNDILKQDAHNHTATLIAAAKEAVRGLDGGDGDTGLSLAMVQNAYKACLRLYHAISVGHAPAITYHLWVASPSRRVALLQLHAVLVRLLADPVATKRMGDEELVDHHDLYRGLGRLLMGLFRLTPDPCYPVFGGAAREVAFLLLRMDWLRSLSVLLSAGRTHPQLQLPPDSLNVDVALAHSVVSDVLPPDTSPFIEEEQQNPEQQQQPVALTQAEAHRAVADLAFLADALARSGWVEHCMAELLQRSVDHTRTRDEHEVYTVEARLVVELLVVILRRYDSVVLDLLGPGGGGGGSGGGAVVEGGSCSEHGASGNGGSSGAAAEDSGPQRQAAVAARFAASMRAILSGPCLQYALAAQVVAQLSAAGIGRRGRVYGLEVGAQLLPDTHETVNGGSLLNGGGMVAALRLWSWCLQQSPPLPLVAYGRRAVHSMSVDMLAVVVISATGHGPSPTGGTGLVQRHLLRALRAESQSVPALEGLRCSALSARWPCVLIGQQQEPAGIHCSRNEAAVAAAAAEFWPVAASALCKVVVGAEAAQGNDKLLVGPLFKQALLEVVVPPFPENPILPPAAPPNLKAAIEADYMYVLERALRMQCRVGHGAPATTSTLLLQAYTHWPRLSRLLAYSPTQEQAAALMLTGVKLLRRLTKDWECQRSAGNKAAARSSNWGGSSSQPQRGLRGVLSCLPTQAMLGWLSAIAAIGKAGSNASATAAAAASGDCSGPSGASGNETSGMNASDSTSSPSGIMRSISSRGHGDSGARDSSNNGGAGGSSGAEATGGAAGPNQPSVAGLSPGAVFPDPASLARGLHGPTRQLLLLTAFTLQQWLPAMAALAMKWVRWEHVLGDVSLGTVSTITSQVLQWVPPLVHASIAAERGVGTADAAAAAPESAAAAAALRAGTGAPTSSSAPTAAGGAFWRSLLLRDLDVLRLLGVVLARVTLMEGSMELGTHVQPDTTHTQTCRTFQEAVSALDCLAVAFPCEVAAALRQGTLPLTELQGMSAHLLQTMGESEERLVLLVMRLRKLAEGGTVAARAAGAAAAVPGVAGGSLADMPAAHGAQSTAGLVGSLLAAAVVPGEVNGLLPCMCGNTGCTNMAGVSEACLPVSACGKCHRVRYCGVECQRVHWRAGHKAECGK